MRSLVMRLYWVYLNTWDNSLVHSMISLLEILIGHISWEIVHWVWEPHSLSGAHPTLAAARSLASLVWVRTGRHIDDITSDVKRSQWCTFIHHVLHGRPPFSSTILGHLNLEVDLGHMSALLDSHSWDCGGRSTDESIEEGDWPCAETRGLRSLFMKLFYVSPYL